jgi:hypothetical protein
MTSQSIKRRLGRPEAARLTLRLDRLGGHREWADALWAALEKVADREVAPLPANASPAHRKAHAKFEAVRARVLAARGAER